jgi:predicted MFS family arabinose efflux permease
VPFLVAWTRRVNRRRLLTTLLAVLAVGNLITSIAPNYPLILGTRLIMGFASGVFWAIGVSMAMRIVPEKHANRAGAVVMSGISIATVVGIPLGTLLESAGDWRTTFLIWAALSALVFLAVAFTIPSLPSANAVSVREVFELPVRNVPLRMVLVMVVFFVLGHFGAYTFVRPYLEENASATVGFITVVLIVFGIGGAIGNLIGGQTVGKSLRGSFIIDRDVCAGVCGPGQRPDPVLVRHTPVVNEFCHLTWTVLMLDQVGVSAGPRSIHRSPQERRGSIAFASSVPRGVR